MGKEKMVYKSNELMKKNFAEWFPQLDANIQLGENNRDYKLDSIAARHGFSKFSAGWQACEDHNEKLLRLKELVNIFFDDYLDYTEETDNGVEFHPIQISSCRVLKSMELRELLKDMKELSR
jgi:hypothetical protein